MTVQEVIVKLTSRDEWKKEKKAKKQRKQKEGKGGKKREKEGVPFDAV